MTELGSHRRPSEVAWYRLHPLSPVVKAGRGLIGLLVVLIPSLVSRHSAAGLSRNILIDSVIVIILLIFGLISWLVTRWQVSEGTLRIETGLIRRSSQRYPLSQVQAIDIVESGIARIFGLAELRLRMAGSGRTRSRLAYLPADQARQLRARLLALAHGVAEDSPEPPEELLVSLSLPMLIISVLLSGVGLIALVLGGTLLTLFILRPNVAVALATTSAASILTFATALWRRFNGYYNLQVAQAPDGFRLRSGLVQTTAETIPTRRVQAVRLVEPLLWRPMGWCRLEVSVAGRRRDRENEAEGRRLRALLPIGTRVQAERLLNQLVPDAPPARSRPPARARLKAPLSYRNLAWGGNDHFVATVSGRLRRSTEWVPLNKVQSIRVVQGPIQKWLSLATVHLDTAGRNVHAELRDQGTDGINKLLDTLVAVCRAART